MINKKDDSITVMEFQKIKYYPLVSKLLLLLGLVGGSILYFVTENLLYLFLCFFVTICGYIYLAYHYRCPDCHSFLWNLRNKKRVKRCPKCQAKLTD